MIDTVVLDWWAGVAYDQSCCESLVSLSELCIFFFHLKYIELTTKQQLLRGGKLLGIFGLSFAPKTTTTITTTTLTLIDNNQHKKQT